MFAYIKTEVQPGDLKAGMLYSMEPADENDVGCHGEELFLALKDAEPVDAEAGHYRTLCHRLIKDPSWGAPPVSGPESNQQPQQMEN